MGKTFEKTGALTVLITTLTLGTSPHPFLLILSYLVHEIGHLAFAKVAGALINKFKIGPMRLSLTYDCSCLTYKREMLVEAGGILANLVFALLLFLFGAQATTGGAFFITCNVSLAIMNLYPVSILDGGGLLKSLLFMILAGDVAEKVSKAVSFVSAILMWLVAVYLQIVFAQGFSLFFISVILLVELCFSAAL